MSIRPNVDELIAFLDSLAKIDPIAMGKLIGARVPCNVAMADHPSVQVAPVGDGWEVGMLGVLNGYGGAFDDGPREGWGAISAVIEGDGSCTGFRRTRLPGDANLNDWPRDADGREVEP